MKNINIAKKVLLFTIMLLILSLMVSCSASKVDNKSSDEVNNSTQTGMNHDDGDAEATMTLTREELKKYNGKDGNPAYIAVDGIIYDVTKVVNWRGGTHNGFEAGNDLTIEMKTLSPHGVSKLKGIPIVGKLAD